MSDPATLLPPNATDQEKTIEAAISTRLEAIPVPLRDLFNPDEIQADLLPWLAWAVETLEFRSDASEADQRAQIKESVALHDILGTPAALKKGLELIGFTDITIIEPLVLLDGTWSLNGIETLSGAYMFDIQIGGVETVTQQQLDEIHRIIEVFSNRRSHLRFLFIGTLVLDGTWTLNGANDLNGGYILG